MKVCEKDLIELCHKVFSSCQKQINEYRENELAEEDLNHHLLKSLVKKIRALQNIDPHITLKIKIKALEEEELAPEKELKNLLKNYTDYDYMSIIKKELLDKAKKSFLTYLIRLVKPKKEKPLEK